jgi:hypothetical protein
LAIRSPKSTLHLRRSKPIAAADLIGAVYPGHAPDYGIPDAWMRPYAVAETGLKRLRTASAEDWETFICGEQGEQEDIRQRQSDLEEAKLLLEAYFEYWPEAWIDDWIDKDTGRGSLSAARSGDVLRRLPVFRL